MAAGHGSLAQWHAHRERHPSRPVIGFSEAGLVLGADTVLVPIHGRQGEPTGNLKSNEARLFALLKIAGEYRVDPVVVERLIRAAQIWARGDKSLAHIYLAQTHAPRLRNEDDAYRLFLADLAFAAGMTPISLLEALEIEPDPWLVAKYEPTQARVPAGSGPTSGQWIKAVYDAIAGLTGRVKAAVKYSLLAPLPAADKAWLAAFAARTASASPVATLGMVFLVASTRSTGSTSKGMLPGHPDVSFELDHDTGRLILQSADGTRIIGHQGADGLYRDVDTGLPVARLVSDASGKTTVVLDDGVVKSWTERGPDTKLGDAPDRPLPVTSTTGGRCPVPAPDRGGGSKRDFEKRFQEYVGAYENPEIQPPIPFSLAYPFPQPNSPLQIMIDHCRQSDGAFIEAKARYGHMLAERWGRISFSKQWLGQLDRQIKAADFNGHRAVVWDVYDADTANFVRNLLTYMNAGDRVSVHQLGYPGNSQWPYPETARWAKGLQKC